MRRTIIVRLMLSLIGSLLAVSCFKTQIPVTSLELDETFAVLKVNETITLVARVAPDNATDKTITWTSSDESVASVVDGLVTALKDGEAEITAKAGDLTAVCEIFVFHPTEGGHEGLEEIKW